MYSVFPYQAKELQTYTSELNRFKADEVKEALEKNYSKVSKVLEESFGLYNLATEQVLDFVQGLIRSDISLSDTPGDDIKKEVDRIYEGKIEFTAEEKALLEKANAWKSDDTMPSELSKVLRKAVKAEKAKDIAKLDDKSKTFEKAMIVGLINDFTRMQWLQSPANLQSKSLETQDSSWDYYADSFRGGHTLAVNSDAYKVGGKSKKLIGVFADGVSLAYTSDQDSQMSQADQRDPRNEIYQANMRLFTGHNLANTLADMVSNFDFDKLENGEVLKEKDSLSDPVAREWTKISKDIFGFMNELKEAGFEYNPNKNFVDECQKFLMKQEKDEAATAIQEKSLQTAILAMMPYFNIIQNIEKALKEKYIDINQAMKMGSTLEYALDLGDKIVIVKNGDSGADCYDSEGKKLEPIQKFRQKDTEARNQGEKHIIPNNYLGIELDENKSAILYDQAPAILLSEAADHYFIRGRQFVGEMSVSIYDKKDVDQIIMASDGCIANGGKSLPEEMDQDAKQNFINLIATNDTDDKTAMVFKKAS